MSVTMLASRPLARKAALRRGLIEVPVIQGRLFGGAKRMERDLVLVVDVVGVARSIIMVL